MSLKRVAVKLALNVSPTTRTATLDNVEYIVAPAVLMPEGVHSGSNGPLYYSANSLAKYCPAWNHKPVVINHPTLNGTPISAANVKVIEDSQVGFLLNVHFQDNKQKGEVWLNKAKVEKVEPKILDNLAAGNKTELSTGLFVDVDETPGVWNGEKYDGEAVVHIPDHLALLPNDVGAASIEDGAGLLANAAKRPVVSDLLRRRLLGNEAVSNQKLTANELSFSQITCKLEEALRTRFGEPGRSWYGFVYAVYADRVVFEDPDYDLYVLSYTIKDNQVTLDSGDPTEVTMVVSYVSTDTGETYAVNAGKLQLVPPTEKKAMNRDEVLTNLIGEGKPFAETDRAFLTALNDDQLSKVAKVPTPAPTANKEKPAVPQYTLKELVDNMDPNDREMLGQMTKVFNSAKESVIDVILKAEGNVFTKDSLSGMNIDVLNGIAAPILAANKKAGTGTYSLDKILNFGPAAPAVTNTAGKKPPTPLGIPTLNAEDIGTLSVGGGKKKTVAA